MKVQIQIFSEWGYYIMDIICKDCDKLQEYGFVKHDRGKGYPPFYGWVYDGVHDGHEDIVVHGFSSELENGKVFGWYEIWNLNKTRILPKLIQLANIGLCQNKNFNE